MYTADANYLDLAYLVARNSTCKDGHMGCVIVQGVDIGQGGELGPACGNVLFCTINTPLFGAYRSDCHAEANAVCECAASLRPTGAHVLAREGVSPGEGCVGEPRTG